MTLYVINASLLIRSLAVRDTEPSSSIQSNHIKLDFFSNVDGTILNLPFINRVRLDLLLAVRGHSDPSILIGSYTIWLVFCWKYFFLISETAFTSEVFIVVCFYVHWSHQLFLSVNGGTLNTYLVYFCLLTKYPFGSLCALVCYTMPNAITMCKTNLHRVSSKVTFNLEFTAWSTFCR